MRSSTESDNIQKKITATLDQVSAHAKNAQTYKEAADAAYRKATQASASGKDNAAAEEVDAMLAALDAADNARIERDNAINAAKRVYALADKIKGKKAETLDRARTRYKKQALDLAKAAHKASIEARIRYIVTTNPGQDINIKGLIEASKDETLTLSSLEDISKFPSTSQPTKLSPSSSSTIQSIDHEIEEITKLMKEAAVLSQIIEVQHQEGELRRHLIKLNKSKNQLLLLRDLFITADEKKRPYLEKKYEQYLKSSPRTNMRKFLNEVKEKVKEKASKNGREELTARKKGSNKEEKEKENERKQTQTSKPGDQGTSSSPTSTQDKEQQSKRQREARQWQRAQNKTQPSSREEITAFAMEAIAYLNNLDKTVELHINALLERMLALREKYTDAFVLEPIDKKSKEAVELHQALVNIKDNLVLLRGDLTKEQRNLKENFSAYKTEGNSQSLGNLNQVAEKARGFAKQTRALVDQAYAGINKADKLVNPPRAASTIQASSSDESDKYDAEAKAVIANIDQLLERLETTEEEQAMDISGVKLQLNTLKSQLAKGKSSTINPMAEYEKIVFANEPIAIALGLGNQFVERRLAQINGKLNWGKKPKQSGQQNPASPTISASKTTTQNQNPGHASQGGNTPKTPLSQEQSEVIKLLEKLSEALELHSLESSMGDTAFDEEAFKAINASLKQIQNVLPKQEQFKNAPNMLLFAALTGLYEEHPEQSPLLNNLLKEASLGLSAEMQEDIKEFTESQQARPVLEGQDELLQRLNSLAPPKRVAEITAVLQSAERIQQRLAQMQRQLEALPANQRNPSLLEKNATLSEYVKSIVNGIRNSEADLAKDLLGADAERKARMTQWLQERKEEIEHKLLKQETRVNTYINSLPISDQPEKVEAEINQFKQNAQHMLAWLSNNEAALRESPESDEKDRLLNDNRRLKQWLENDVAEITSSIEAWRKQELIAPHLMARMNQVKEYYQEELTKQGNATQAHMSRRPSQHPLSQDPIGYHRNFINHHLQELENIERQLTATNHAGREEEQEQLLDAVGDLKRELTRQLDEVTEGAGLTDLYKHLTDPALGQQQNAIDHLRKTEQKFSASYQALEKKSNAYLNSPVVNNDPVSLHREFIQTHLRQLDNLYGQVDATDHEGRATEKADLLHKITELKRQLTDQLNLIADGTQLFNHLTQPALGQQSQAMDYLNSREQNFKATYSELERQSQAYLHASPLDEEDDELSSSHAKDIRRIAEHDYTTDELKVIQKMLTHYTRKLLPLLQREAAEARFSRSVDQDKIEKTERELVKLQTDLIAYQDAIQEELLAADDGIPTPLLSAAGNQPNLLKSHSKIIDAAIERVDASLKDLRKPIKSTRTVVHRSEEAERIYLSVADIDLMLDPSARDSMTPEEKADLFNGLDPQQKDKLLETKLASRMEAMANTKPGDAKPVVDIIATSHTLTPAIKKTDAYRKGAREVNVRHDKYGDTQNPTHIFDVHREKAGKFVVESYRQGPSLSSRSFFSHLFGGGRKAVTDPAIRADRLVKGFLDNRPVKEKGLSIVLSKANNMTKEEFKHVLAACVVNGIKPIIDTEKFKNLPIPTLQEALRTHEPLKLETVPKSNVDKSTEVLGRENIRLIKEDIEKAEKDASRPAGPGGRSTT